MMIILLSTALAAQATALPVVTPASVERMIEMYGAKRAVDTLISTPKDGEGSLGDYDIVLDGVSSGDPDWLALVAKLDPGTDAATAETLRIAVAEALPKNAAGVLRLTSRLSWFRDACSYPMIEPTNEEAEAYFKVAIPALEGVHDPALRHAKGVCLAALIEAEHAT